MASPVIFDGVFGVPYTDPVSHMCLSSVLGAHPSVQSSHMAIFADGDGRSTPFSPDGLGGCSSVTPPTASAHGDCRSTPAPLTAPIGCVDAYDSLDPRLPLALGACLHVPSVSFIGLYG